jgi:DNA-binding MarR family transcriptional regulator
MAKQIEVALSDLDLSIAQYRALGILEENPDLSSRLAEKLNIRAPSLTAVIDTLVSKNYVVRQNHPLDRRKITIDISELGKEILTEADAAVSEKLRELLSYLNSDDVNSALSSTDLWGLALKKRSEQKRTIR